MTTSMSAAGARKRALSDTIALAAGLDARLLVMILILVAIWLGFDVATHGTFLSARNLFNLSLQVSVVGIMTCGMVLVIVARHIDLSVGSQLGFIGVFGALLQTEILPIDGAATWWLACLAMLALGAVIGLLQGALVAYAGIPSFVVTLGGIARYGLFGAIIGPVVAALFNASLEIYKEIYPRATDATVQEPNAKAT